MRQLQAAQSRQGVTGPTIESADAARPLPSPPATTSPGGNASLDAIMQKIRPEPSSARNIADASRGPRPSPSQVPAATAQKRQVAGVPGGMPNAAPNASTAPAPPREWPVDGYDRTPDGTTSRAGQVGPNGRPFSGDGRFDPTGAKGFRHGRRHMGLDLPAQLGDPVRAAADGVVVKVEPQIGPLHYWTKDKKGQPVQRFLMQPKRDKAGNPVYDENGRAVVEHVIGLVGYGNRVWIDHPDGTQTTYNHLQSRSPLALGTKVKAGQTIGSVGVTGNAAGFGSHLHFEVRRLDRKSRSWVPIDPTQWINGTP
jgi:murein DD-endopeptidase MepM/ murein hydrolase activator NlpD